MVKGVSIGAIQSFGVRLNETDVALAAVAAVERSVTARNRRWPRNVHRAVGIQARVLAATTQLSPNWANRLLTERLTRRQDANKRLLP